jgi:hypothetical protein
LPCHRPGESEEESWWSWVSGVRERGVCVRGVAVNSGVDHSVNGCQTMLGMDNYHRW